IRRNDSLAHSACATAHRDSISFPMAFSDPPATAAPRTPLAPDLSDAAIAQRFQARREFILREAVAAVVPGDTSQGSKFDIAACLHRGENVDAALARLARLDDAPPSGDMFWVY